MAQTEEEKKTKAREATRKWRANNRERANALARASQKKWREENPELHRARAKEWKAQNIERFQYTRAKWRKEQRDHLNAYRRKQHYKNKYGLTIEQRDALLAAQDHCCAVCSARDPGNKIGWVVDHRREPFKVRGILCHFCNLALGNVKDNTETLHKLIHYLEKHKCQT
jgi:Recombination endonuclease VII